MVLTIHQIIEIPLRIWWSMSLCVGYADSQVQAWRRQLSPTVAAVEKSAEIPHVFLDKVVDMPVIVNDRVLHSGGPPCSSSPVFVDIPVVQHGRG